MGKVVDYKIGVHNGRNEEEAGCNIEVVEFRFGLWVFSG